MTAARHLHAVPTPQDTGPDDAPDDTLGGGVVVVPSRHLVIEIDRTPALALALIAMCLLGMMLTAVWIVAAVLG
jgi:hypothetical protein